MRLIKNSLRSNQSGFDHILAAVAFVVVTGIVGTGFIVVKGHHTAGTSHAAVFGNQWCITDIPYMCLNAWNGGPWVKVYNKTGTGNNDFAATTLKNGNTYIMDSGNNASYGHCIGDANNSSGNASTSLDTCPTNSSSGGWGTNFRMGTCATRSGTGYSFYNIHWNKYLGPGGATNGSLFYLNKPSVYCFTKIGAA